MAREAYEDSLAGDALVSDLRSAYAAGIAAERARIATLLRSTKHSGAGAPYVALADSLDPVLR